MIRELAPYELVALEEFTPGDSLHDGIRSLEIAQDNLATTAHTLQRTPTADTCTAFGDSITAIDLTLQDALSTIWHDDSLGLSLDEQVDFSATLYVTTLESRRDGYRNALPRIAFKDEDLNADRSDKQQAFIEKIWKNVEDGDCTINTIEQAVLATHVESFLADTEVFTQGIATTNKPGGYLQKLGNVVRLVQEKTATKSNSYVIGAMALTGALIIVQDVMARTHVAENKV